MYNPNSHVGGLQRPCCMHLFFWGRENQIVRLGMGKSLVLHSLAIVHGKVLVAPLQPVAVVVAGAAVAPALPIVLQDLLKALRTGATQYGGPHHRLAVVGHGRLLVVGRSFDAVALRVVHKDSLLDYAAMLAALHLREIGK